MATAAIWRTFQQDGKINTASEGGGTRPPPVTLVTHHVHKVAVYAPAERADSQIHSSFFISTPICTLCPPPFTLFTIMYKVAMYAPAESADTLTLFHCYPYMYSVQ